MDDINNLRKQIRDIEGQYNRLDNGDCFFKTGFFEFDNALRGGIYNGQVCEIMPQTYIDEVAQIEFASVLAGMALRKSNGDFILISDGYFTQEWGEFYPIGFERFGINSNRILNVKVKSKFELQSCAIEVAKTIGLGAVLILSGRKNSFDLSMARKLQIAANLGGAPCFLASAYGAEGFAPSHLRLGIKSYPSQLPQWAYGMVRRKITPLGNPAWRVEILKSRIGAIGKFNLEFDYETYNLRGISLFSDGQAVPIEVNKRFA